MNEPRPLSSLLALLLLPLFIGAAIAPHVYNVLVHFFDVDFERVVKRCITVLAVLFLFPLFRRAGLAESLKSCLRFSPERRRDLIIACVLGFSSMALLYLVGLKVGAYRVHVGLSYPALFRVFGFLVSAILIGVFEEAFFRGFVFGALRSRVSFWASAGVASVFFSSVHFMEPRLLQPMLHAHPLSGFELIPHMFDHFNVIKHGPFALTLFLMGLTLCAYYERKRHLWYAIGLHGGWVLAMMMGILLLDRNRDFLERLFSRSDNISHGLIAIPVILIFFIMAVRSKSSRVI